MAKKTKRKSGGTQRPASPRDGKEYDALRQWCERGGLTLEQARAEAMAGPDERVYGKQAVDYAHMTAAVAAASMADFVDTVYRGQLSEQEKSAMLAFFKYGVLHGYLMAAEEAHAARKRGIAKATAARNGSSSNRYAEIAAYYATTSGPEAQREIATAAHFGITDRTVRRAIKSSNK
jgi:hypothetical protein